MHMTPLQRAEIARREAWAREWKQLGWWIVCAAAFAAVAALAMGIPG